MKAIRLCFIQMIRFIRRDMMLFAACFAPVLCGLFFRFGMPLLEEVLTGWLARPSVFTPYYGLLDMFFSMLSPVMFCFVAAMVVLEETDDHIAGYLFITTLGRKGYLASRLGVPAAIAFAVTLVLLPVFRLTELCMWEILFLSAGGVLQGIIIALLIVSVSSNKLEGLAAAKLSTLMTLGALVPYCVPDHIQYLFSPLPSYWIGKAVCDQSVIWMLPAVVSSLGWIGVMMRRFLRKLA
ncbi:ABC transporter permease [Ruminococcus sp. OA3]|uniref:ABC transporter permease n=1 Tax=Ruminococcus sp. OA3 TaxID=2914164 RepID=UPI001F052FD8|nr:ABC transporter permease [Ruminococcus sp. OA3]MCH1982439.1 ABC transporter permease [Ruminococcus sp. OA3]